MALRVVARYHGETVARNVAQPETTEEPVDLAILVIGGDIDVLLLIAIGIGAAVLAGERQVAVDGDAARARDPVELAAVRERIDAFAFHARGSLSSWASARWKRSRAPARSFARRRTIPRF